MDTVLSYYLIVYSLMLYVAMLNFTQASVINFILFEKANQNPWKAFIPYYSNFIQHKLTFGNKNGFGSLIYLCQIFMAVTPIINGHAHGDNQEDFQSFTFSFHLFVAY